MIRIHVCGSCGNRFEAILEKTKFCSRKCSNVRYGRVRTKDNAEDWFWPSVSRGRKTECWYWRGKDNNKYGNTAFPNYKSRQSSHRIAFWIHNGKMPDGLIMHTCNKKSCCNPHHLIEGDHKKNLNDAVKDGLIPSGENSPYSILKESEVVSILRSKESHAKLAKKHGVHRSTILHIKHRNTWKHVTF